MRKILQYFPLFAPLALLCLLLTGCGMNIQGIEPLPKTGTIHGFVSTSRSVTVQLDGTDLSVPLTDTGFWMDSVPTGLHTLVASDGTSACSLTVAVKPCSLNIGSLVLSPSGGVSGTVSDESRKPLSGVSVTVTPIVQTNSLTTTALPVRTTTTDEDGNYQIKDLAVGDHLVALSKDGYRTTSIKFSVRADVVSTEDTSLQREPTRNVGHATGTVPLRMDSALGYPGGGPELVPGALITLRPAGTPAPVDPLAITEHCTFSSAKGSYNLSAPEGNYILSAVRPGFESVEKQVRITAGGTTKEDLPLNLHLPKRCVLQGTVTNQTSKRPIENAYILVKMSPSKEPTSGIVITPAGASPVAMDGWTDQNGRYTLLVPVVAGTSLHISARAFSTKDVTVAPVVGTLTSDLALAPSGTGPVILSGIVRTKGIYDPDSVLKIVPNASVWVSSANDDGYRSYHTDADANGKYLLELPPGDYKVTASTNPLGSSGAYPVTVQADATADVVIYQ